MLHKFSELDARRVVFQRAARSVANRIITSFYVKIGNPSTDRENAVIPGSTATLARKFMQLMGELSCEIVKDRAERTHRYATDNQTPSNTIFCASSELYQAIA